MSLRQVIYCRTTGSPAEWMDMYPKLSLGSWGLHTGEENDYNVQLAAPYVSVLFLKEITSTILPTNGTAASP